MIRTTWLSSSKPVLAQGRSAVNGATADTAQVVSPAGSRADRTADSADDWSRQVARNTRATAALMAATGSGGADWVATGTAASFSRTHGSGVELDRGNTPTLLPGSTHPSSG
jgi:hypothetical protein